MTSPSFLIACGIVALVSLVQPTRAATYNFDLIYNGTEVSLSADSDIPHQTQLDVGDSFVLSVAAQGDAFFRTLTSFSQFAAASFATTAPGTRVADIVTSLFLDGNLVSQRFESSVSQAQLHIGGQDLVIDDDTSFDRLELNYTLSAASAPVTPAQTPDILAYAPFFFSSAIAFEGDASPPAPVPLPGSALTLLGAGGLLGLMARRRRRPGAGCGPSGASHPHRPVGSR